MAENTKPERSFYIAKEADFDVVELAALFSSYYDKSNNITDPDFLRWQYLDNPHGKAIVSSARSLADGTLVGVYIVNPIMLNVVGKAAISLNTFTHAEHRGQGMFPLLAQDCYDKSKKRGVNAVIGFPNEMSYSGFVKKLDFIHLLDVKYLVKFRNPLYQLGGAGLVLAKYKPSVHERKLDEFLESQNTENGISNSKSLKYIQWRYIDHPKFKYDIYCLEQKDVIVGYIVVKRKSSTVSQLLVMELGYRSRKGMKFLLAAVFSHYSFSTIVLRLYANMNSSQIALNSWDTYDSNVFRKTKVSLPYIYKDLSGGTIPLKEDFVIQLGDTDIE